MLKALGSETDTVIVVREGHWAVGWVEWIAIHESDETALRIADRLASKLEDYPILNEDDFGEEEQSEANDVWRECYSSAERVRYIRDHRSEFEFHNYADLIACVRGHYFAGYASELIS